MLGRLRQLRFWIASIALLGVGGLLWFMRQLHEAPGSRVGSASDVHVCFCTDDPDLRPLAAAINSTALSAGQPQKLVVHVITIAELAPIYEEVLPSYLPPVRLQIHHDSALMARVQSAALLQDALPAPGRPSRHFSLVPFFIPAFLVGSGSSGKASEEAPQMQRFIYLDTDVLVRGDISDLFHIGLQGHPVALVPDCLGFDAELWRRRSMRLGLGLREPPACGVKPGLFVADAQLWREVGITERVEAWAAKYHGQPRKGADSALAPWLLVADYGYAGLDDDWNCDGLGRAAARAADATHWRLAGFDLPTLRGAAMAESARRPAVVTCSLFARLLHFSGPRKPWLKEDDPPTGDVSMCLVPNALVASSWLFQRIVRVAFQDSPVTFVPCAELWQMAMSPAANCALRDFDKEWGEEELVWTGTISERDAAAAKEEEEDIGEPLEELAMPASPPPPLPASTQPSEEPRTDAPTQPPVEQWDEELPEPYPPEDEEAAEPQELPGAGAEAEPPSEPSGQPPEEPQQPATSLTPPATSPTPPATSLAPPATSLAPPATTFAPPALATLAPAVPTLPALQPLELPTLPPTEPPPTEPPPSEPPPTTPLAVSVVGTPPKRKKKHKKVSSRPEAPWGGMEARLRSLSYQQLRRSFKILGMQQPDEGTREELIAQLLTVFLAKAKEASKKAVASGDGAAAERP